MPRRPQASVDDFSSLSPFTACILAQMSESRDYPADGLAGKHPKLASAVGGAEAPNPLGSHSGGCGPEHGVRAGTSAGGDDSLDTRPDRATRVVETAHGILGYQELAMFSCHVRGRNAAKSELVREVFNLGDSHVLVEQIPAQVCGHCGKATFSRETTEQIRRMVQGASHPVKTAPPRFCKRARTGCRLTGIGFAKGIPF